METSYVMNPRNESFNGLNDVGSTYELVYMYSSAVVAILTNFLFVVTLLCKPCFRRSNGYLLLYLSVCCSTTVTISILRYLIQTEALNFFWLQLSTGDFTCRILIFLQRMCVAATALSTMTISDERIKTIRNPMVRRSSKHYKKRMLCVTFYSIVISIPAIFSRAHDKRVSQNFKCRKITIGNSILVSALHGIWQFCTTMFIPMLKLLYEHWKTRFQIKYLLTKPGRRVLTEDRHQQLFLTSCICSGIFVLCWIPYGILLGLKDLPKELFPTFDLQQKIGQCYRAARNLVLLHIGVNPLLFILLNYQWTFKGFFKTLTSPN